jgi:uncharacterized membrane protein YfcA
VPEGGRRRQTTTPLRRRLRRDLLGWGLLAGVCAALVLGLTGGGWGRALVLALLVVGACAVLTLLAGMSSKPPTGGRHGGSAP